MDALRQTLDRIAAGFANARETLPSIVSDPRAHPREAMLIAVIAALGVLFILTAVLQLFDVVSTRIKDRRRGVRVARRMRPTVVLVLGAALVVLAVASAQLPALSAVGSACDACHAMNEPVDTWKAGAHGGVGCWDCHASRSVMGRTAASAREFVRWVGPATTESAQSVDSRSCLSCHDDLDKEIVGTSVRVQHADIITAGIQCVECHPDAGHAALASTERRLVRKPMTTCLVCHDGVRASAACSLCHEARPSDQAKEPGDGTATIRSDCTGECHANSPSCDSCHGLEMPHPATFKREHAARSAKDPALCARCHPGASSAQACGCHVDGPTHGSYSEWFQAHGAQAAQVGPGGCLCHDNAGFGMCLKCHEHSPW